MGLGNCRIHEVSTIIFVQHGRFKSNMANMEAKGFTNPTRCVLSKTHWNHEQGSGIQRASGTIRMALTRHARMNTYWWDET